MNPETIAELRAEVRRAHERLPSIGTPMMGGDNLAVTLCSHFEDAEGEQDDNGWTEAATRGYEEVIAAIQAHYAKAFTQLLDALDAKDKRIAEVEALCDRLKLEAQMHAGEARTHKSSLHEAYQAVSGATGEPGNWHGAEPIKVFVAEARGKLDREAVARVLYQQEVDRSVHAQKVLAQATGKPCVGILMDPWDECKDSFLSDADAIIALQEGKDG